MAAHLCRSLRLLLVLMLAGGLSACALFQARDPLTISVIGIEPLPGQELEMRMAVKMRVQNPNESAIDYSGVALNLEVNGQPLASGVSDQQGRIGRYDEAVIVVPVSITAFAFAPGLWPGKLDSLQGMPYKLRGKLAGGPFGTVRFTDEGKLDLPRKAACIGRARDQRLALAAAIILLTSLRTMLANSGGDIASSSARTSAHLPLRRGFRRSVAQLHPWPCPGCFATARTAGPFPPRSVPVPRSSCWPD